MTPGRPYGLDVLVLIPGVVPLEPIPFRGIWMGVYPAVQLTTNGRTIEMSILWTIIIGFIAGVIAKFIMPGDNEPSGFILTTILGIVSAFVATYLAQAIGRPQTGVRPCRLNTSTLAHARPGPRQRLPAAWPSYHLTAVVGSSSPGDINSRHSCPALAIAPSKVSR